MIGFFSPLPPAPTGVADYAQDLVARLRPSSDVRVFSAPPVPEHECKQTFYQLGNNKLHRWIYEEALKRPGVIVLHDALLQHMLLGESWEAWEREFVFTYGERGREIAATLRDGIPALQEGFFRYPLVKRVVEASRRVIVTNLGAAARVRRESPGADVRVIPLPFLRSGKEVAKADARRELGIPPATFLIGSFGHMR